MRWREFAEDCPELAALTAERFRRDELVLVGTLRPDGSPRVSAIEPDVAAGELFLGMMPDSVKADDLLRDPRVTVHSWPPSKDNQDGDIKLYGRAVEVTDPAGRHDYEDAIFARTRWRPKEPYHCFVVDVDSAGMVRFDSTGREEVWHWRPGRPLRKREIMREY